MSTTIESLELQVQSSATSAVGGIDALTASLSKLKNATKGGVGLNSVANQLRNLNTALSAVDGSSADKIDKLANSLNKLKSLGSIKISSSIGNQLKSIGSAASALNSADLSGIGKLATALQPLNNIGKASGLQSAITQLNKLPQLAQTLNGINWSTLTSQLQQLSNALAPLANQLNTVSTAFSRMPANIRSVVSATNSMAQANDKASNSYMNLWAKARMVYNGLRGSVNAISSWVRLSNDYIENLNLFTVSMGEYAQEAQRYAEQVGDILGIDPSEWMRNQGVFNTIITGFGTASDKAYLMSKNLTQLGYDLSSFFNIPVEDAMQKLESGISGELEPLRRLGYDLSVARLQQEALNLGIEKSVSDMTQAEKSQLRYYAIMTQVTASHGDMARTLNAPANQFRVLKAQVIQCARALGNLFIPIINALLPYAIALAKVIRYVAEMIASIFKIKLPSVDFGGISAGSSAVGDLADNADNAAGGLGKAGKEAKKLKNNLLGIDELNILSDNPASSAAGGAGGAGGGGLGGGDLGFDLPDMGDWLDGLVTTRVDEIVEKIKGALMEITAVISGFLLAIGTILVVTGANIPVGLGLMAIGAVGLVATIAENWNAMSERLAKTLTLVTGVLGGFLLAIGAFLVFSGVNVPLGAGLMVAGAVSLATAATINWKFLHGDMSNALSILTGIVSGALLAMGALFAFTGVSVPLGIALMAAGAVGLATAVGLNWKAMSDPMRKAIGTLEAIVGGALLTFGAILALTGVNIPLGIGMIAAGAISLVSAVALNWGALTGDLKGSISTITAIVSGALIGIGAILALTGVATPLGIAMIAAGAVGIVATASLNWGAITKKINSVLKEIGIAMGMALIALGAILAFTGVALPLGVALIAAGAVSLVSGVALNWDSIVNKIKDVLKKIGIVAGISMLALGLILCLTGVGIPLGVGLIAAGAASLAAGVALNWDSIKETIKGVLNKIKNVAGSVGKLALGLILCLSGVGIPAGIALIASGVKDFATGKPVSWNEMVDKVKGGLDTISEKFGDFKKNVGKKLDEAKKNITEWSGNVKEFFTKGADGKNAIDNIKEAASEWGDSFKKGLSDKFSNAKSWVKSNITTPLSKAIEKNPVSDLAVNIKNTSKDWWDKAKTWWGNVSSKGVDVEAGVQLVKEKWSTVKGWIGNIPIVKQGIALGKHLWSTVKNWVGEIPTLEQGISLAKRKWDSVKSWVGNIPIVQQGVELAKEKWDSVKNWIGKIPSVSQFVHLLKDKWETVRGWIGNIPSLSQYIHLLKDKWTSVKNWIGNIPSLSQFIHLLKDRWTSVKNWIGNIPSLSQYIELAKSGWSKVSSWVQNFLGGSVEEKITLAKSGWNSVAGWVRDRIGGAVDVTVNLISKWKGKIKEFFGLSSGGIVSAGGGIKLFADGGYINGNRSGFWKNIPMYANGTTNAGLHGSMFVAGENGAEMVGHINGQTEVLNRSQIAMAMKSATIAGMSQFVGYWRSMVGQMAVCTNAIVRAVLVSSDMTQVAFATATSYDPTNYLSQSVYEDSQRGYSNNFSDDSMSRTLREFYQEYVEPTLKDIASDAKRQADKEEQTIVQVGNRTITDAVETQQKANGYKFTK